MSAQTSNMHKIIGSVRYPFDRMARTSRSLVAAARLHPAGFAVPSAVIAVAVAFVTLVTAVVVRVLPPNLFGTGSPPIIQPSTSQPRHRPHQQPVLAGPPTLGPSGGSRWHNPTGSHEQSPGSDATSALPMTLATSPTLPTTSGPRLTAGHNPASSSQATTPGMVSVTVGTSGPVAQVSQTATPVVSTTETTVGQAVQGVTGVIGTVTGTVGATTGAVSSVAGTAVTGTVAAVTGTVASVTGTVASVTGTVATVTGTVGVVTGTVGAATNTAGVAASEAESAATVSVSELAGNGPSQPAVSLPISVPGLG